MDRIKILLELIEENPKEPFNHYALALEYKKIEEVQNAQNRFELLLKEHSDFIATYYHYADLLVNMEDFNYAMEIYDKGIKQAQDQGDHHSLSELKNAKLNLEIELD